MEHESVALIALVAFFVVIVGVRAALQHGRTGDHGLRFTRRSAPGVQIATEVAWGLVTLGFSLAVVLAFLGVLPSVMAAPPAVIGGATCALAIALAFISQLAMGTSWRVGLGAGEQTALVRHGPFAVVRNPIYSAILLFLFGLMLLVPNALLIAAGIAALIDVELTVRFVEEPHLLRVHGDAYRAYAERVGRFVPVLGRWRASDAARIGVH